MRALTVAPGVANSARVEDVPDPPASDGAVLVRTLALAFAAPTGISFPGNMVGPRRAPTGWCSATNRSAKCKRRPPVAESKWATLSSASCVGPTRCPVRRAPSANGICVATAATPSAASRSETALAQSFFGSSLTFWSRSIQRSGSPVYCSSRRALSPRPGTTPSASVIARASWQPKTLLVTGAGPVGLLAALMGAQRGLDVHVLDHHDNLLKRGWFDALGSDLSRRESRRT